MLLPDEHTNNTIRSKTVNTISTLLTDICEESTLDKDTNTSNICSL